MVWLIKDDRKHIPGDSLYRPHSNLRYIDLYHQEILQYSDAYREEGIDNPFRYFRRCILSALPLHTYSWTQILPGMGDLSMDSMVHYKLSTSRLGHHINTFHSYNALFEFQAETSH